MNCRTRSLRRRLTRDMAYEQRRARYRTQLSSTGVKGRSSPAATNSLTAANQANQSFLKWAPKVPAANIQWVGTAAGLGSGGSQSLYIPSQVVPAIPVWATDLVWQNDIQVTLSIAGGASIVVSPFAPYSFLSSQLTLAGSPPWNFMEHVPWAFDVKFTSRNYDPLAPGLSLPLGGTYPTPFVDIIDLGPDPLLIPASPGATITNTGSSPATVGHHWTWVDTIRLQRFRKGLWGCIPLGDPQNRPNLKLMLNALIGTQPETSPYVSSSSGSTTAVVKAGTTSTCQLIIKALRLDVIPTNTPPPTPQVKMGVTVNAYAPSITAAGIIQQYVHQQSQLYEAIHHLVINNQLAQESDYFGLWDTQEQRSNKWEYDAQQNTYQQYFDDVKKVYHRPDEYGHLLANFERGEYPDIPGETPYDAFVTPDFGYAQMFGLVPTPNMTTASRIPSGTSINGAYCKIYEFGLVSVSY